MKEFYITKNFSARSLSVIDQVNVILEEYRADGYVLTLRQLYYQLVARGFIENTIRSYKRIVDIIGNARLAGLVDWYMLTDRNRVTVSPPHWESPAEIVDAAAKQFAIDKWERQPVHVEVMVEKDALSGVLGPACHRLDILFTANKGYNSLSNMHDAGKRLAKYIQEGKDVVILYFGDHDPSGIDMTRDITERLSLFSGYPVQVDRLALNYDQIDALNPPPNPAKETDSRYQVYLRQFGDTSWELDAIEPRALVEMVEQAVSDLLDDDLWEESVEEENDMREDLEKFAKGYGK
jgi:hypothetical protein